MTKLEKQLFQRIWESGVARSGIQKVLPDFIGESMSQTQGVVISAPDTAAVDAVHEAFLGNDALNAFPGPFANPDVPRNVTVQFEAGWDGGDVTVVGTDQFDAVIQEVFTAAAGTTVAGSKCFKTVVSATKGAVGAAATFAQIGCGLKLGLGKRPADAFFILTATGIAESGTLDQTNATIQTTTAPNGSVVFRVLVNVNSWA